MSITGIVGTAIGAFWYSWEMQRCKAAKVRDEKSSIREKTAFLDEDNELYEIQLKLGEVGSLELSNEQKEDSTNNPSWDNLHYDVQTPSVASHCARSEVPNYLLYKFPFWLCLFLLSRSSLFGPCLNCVLFSVFAFPLLNKLAKNEWKSLEESCLSNSNWNTLLPVVRTPIFFYFWWYDKFVVCRKFGRKVPNVRRMKTLCKAQLSNILPFQWPSTFILSSFMWLRCRFASSAFAIVRNAYILTKQRKRNLLGWCDLQTGSEHRNRAWLARASKVWIAFVERRLWYECNAK